MPPRKGQHTSPATEIKPGERRSPATEFKPGEPTAYRHPKGFRAAPETEFKHGQEPHNFTGVGVPRSLREGEYTVTTEALVQRESRGRKYTTKKRTSYPRYLWEKEFGPIPEGMIVYNNNYPNLPTKEDLELITRGELAKRNKRR